MRSLKRRKSAIMLSPEEIKQIRSYHSWHLVELIKEKEPYIGYLCKTQADTFDWQETVVDLEQVVSLCKAELARRGKLT
jgi:hypothetical protein